MEWGGRREEGAGWGTHVYLWWIHFDIWQNEYSYVKFKNKIKLKKKKAHLLSQVSWKHWPFESVWAQTLASLLVGCIVWTIYSHLRILVSLHIKWE